MSDSIAPDGTLADALLERLSWLAQWKGSYSIVVNPHANDLEQRVMISLHEPPRIIEREQPPYVIRAHGSNIYAAIRKLQVWVYKRAVAVLKQQEHQGQVAEGA